MNFLTMSVPQLQAIVRDNNIECHDRRRRINLEAAIEVWQAKQAQALQIVSETAIEVQSATVESVAESVVMADRAEILASELAVKVIEVLTSDEAIGAYKAVLRVIVIGMAFVCLMVFKLGRWCWAHRSQTTVYHWVSGAARSRAGETLGAIVMVGLELVRYAVNAAIGWRDSVVIELRAIGEGWLRPVGLGGCSIEVQ